MKPIQFVNAFGCPIDPEAIAKKHKKTRPPAEARSYHKGFRVVGFAPGRIEQAEADHNKERAEKLAGEEPQDIGAWSADTWRTKSKKTPVRSKPYEILSAANECMELAIKSGWIDVGVIPVCKDASE